MWYFNSRTWKYIATGILFLIGGYSILVLPQKPSLTRDWSSDQRILARTEFSENRVSITNIRNAKYRTKDDYDIHYYDKTFDLDKIETLWYVVEPFAGYGKGAAHTFVSFGFEGGDYIAISAEIRKEKDESFSALSGLFRQYELVYIVADERDVLGLRANYRNDDVFLYPVRVNKEQIRALFIAMLTRANILGTKPEFYNTLTNNCTTSIVNHANDIVQNPTSLWNYKILMPGYSDKLAQELGLIDSSISITELRAKYRINERAALYASDPLFSQRIREK